MLITLHVLEDDTFSTASVGDHLDDHRFWMLFGVLSGGRVLVVDQVVVY
jgi:hypothetical protein